MGVKEMSPISKETIEEVNKGNRQHFTHEGQEYALDKSNLGGNYLLFKVDGKWVGLTYCGSNPGEFFE